VQRFFAICKTANSKPYWSGYSERNDKNDSAFAYYLPPIYRSVFVPKQSSSYQGANISCHFIPYSESLPKFITLENDGTIAPKSYKVPTAFKMSQILNYLYDTLRVKEAIIDTNRDN
jgi:hypothetical protein